MHNGVELKTQERWSNYKCCEEMLVITPHQSLVSEADILTKDAVQIELLSCARTTAPHSIASKVGYTIISISAYCTKLMHDGITIGQDNCTYVERFCLPLLN